MKIVRRVLLGIASIFLLATLLAVWVIFTRSGTQTAARIAPSVMPPGLTIGAVQGVLGRRVRLIGLRFSDPESGIDLRLEEATVCFELSGLPHGRLHVREATVTGLTLIMTDATPERSEHSGGSAGLPLDIELDRVTVQRGSVRIGTRVINIDRAELAGSYTRGKLALTRLELTEGNSRLSATGALSLTPAVSWNLRVTAETIDPRVVLPTLPGSVSFRLTSKGQFVAGEPRGTARVDALLGHLDKYEISGGGSLSLRPGMLLTGDVKLHVGHSVLHLTGVAGRSLDVTADVDIDSLGALHPALRGAVTSRLHVTGRWPLIAIDASGRADNVAVGDLQIGAAQLRASVRDPRNATGEVHIDARNLAIGAFRFDTLVLGLSGSTRSHSMQLHAAGPRIKSELTARGSYGRNTWTGVLETAALNVSGAPPVALQAPAQIDVSSHQFRLSNTCLAGAEISACASGEVTRDGQMSLRYTIDNLPLTLLAKLAMPDGGPLIEGALEGDGDLRRERDGKLAGHAQLAIPMGAVAAGSATDASRRIEFQNLSLDANLAGDSGQMQLAAKLLQGGDVSGRLLITHARSANPLLQGEVDLRGLNREWPALGLNLRDGAFSAALQADHAVKLSGHIASGDGALEVDGIVSPSTLQLTAHGRELLAADIPGARIVVSPQLKLDGPLSEPRLTGTLEIPAAEVDVSKLSVSGGQRPSPDVVVIDRQHTEATPPRRLNSDVTVKLGENVRLSGFGLDAHLQGELRIRERPNAASVAFGEIRLAGTYEAYGRKLTIERGKLQFAGTSLENPELDILAIRKVKEVTAKLHVTGTAQHPQLSVSGEPAMSSAEALSYLVSGKPLDDLREEEDTLLTSAAQSLGGMVGDRLTRKVAGRFGIDSAGVGQSAELGGTALTVGKYLSPRLFVSYGVGLFDPGHVMTLRYEISNHWSVEADQAPENQHAGVRYRIEK